MTLCKRDPAQIRHDSADLTGHGDMACAWDDGDTVTSGLLYIRHDTDLTLASDTDLKPASETGPMRIRNKVPVPTLLARLHTIEPTLVGSFNPQPFGVFPVALGESFPHIVQPIALDGATSPRPCEVAIIPVPVGQIRNVGAGGAVRCVTRPCRRGPDAGVLMVAIPNTWGRRGELWQQNDRQGVELLAHVDPLSERLTLCTIIRTCGSVCVACSL